MRIATWNINGIHSRLTHVLKWCEMAEPDVLCLQETKTPDLRFPQAAFRNAGYKHIAIHGEKSYNGVAIISRVPLDDVVCGFPGEKEGEPRRVVSAVADGVQVISAYFPHGTKIGSDKFHWKIDWVKRLRKYFDKYYSSSDDVVMCADTNICAHEMDMWNVTFWAKRMHFTPAERESFMNLKKWGFVDIFRQFNDQPGEYTWWDTFRESSFPKNRGLRLDYIWTSPPMADRCLDCWVDRVPRGWDHPSDHAPVVAEFR